MTEYKFALVGKWVLAPFGWSRKETVRAIKFVLGHARVQPTIPLNVGVAGAIQFGNVSSTLLLTGIGE